MLHLASACQYHPIATSDHAPVSIDIHFPLSVTPAKLWRFSSHLLSDDKFKDFVNSQIRLYIEINDTADVSCGTVWEALKAYVRGQVISYVSKLRKDERVRLSAILEELLRIDETYSSSPSPTLYKKRILLHSEHDLLMTSVAERQLRQTKQRFFEQGDKAGRLLAQQARAVNASRLIPKVKSPEGNLVSDPIEINKSFFEFYNNLYTSECPIIGTINPNPLDSLTFPQIDVVNTGRMGDPISTLEIQEAIKSMQNGKSPGPDGFTVEFYKAYSFLLAPILARMYNDSLKEGRLPQTLHFVAATDQFPS